MDGFNCLTATEPLRGDSSLLTTNPKRSWYSFDRPWKHGRISCPWSYPVVLNPEPLDTKSSALTKRPSFKPTTV